jgi:glc operon protein GlcG
MIQRYQLSHRDAQAILAAVQTELEKDNLGAAVAVVDSQGELLAFLRTDGCRLPSITIAINKAFTAAREQRPSRAIGQSSREDGWPMTNFGDPRYVGWGGGVPVLFQDQVVGAVGVSGLPEDVDVELAQIGAAVPLQVVLPVPLAD